MKARIPEINPPQRGEGFPRVIFLDDAKAGLAGTWGSSTGFAPYVGEGYRFAGARDSQNDGTAVATFRFTAPEAGTYRLAMAYSPDTTRASNVPLTVTSGKHVTKFTVDQTLARPPGSTVREIGKVELVSGLQSLIAVGTAGTNGFVILNAIKLSPETAD